MPFHKFDSSFKMSEKPLVYGFPLNCFCLSICKAMESLGLKPELVPVSYGVRREIITLTSGDYYMVPVMQYKDKIISDSLDIVRYVDQEHGGKLFPKEKEGLQDIILPWLDQECHHAVEMLTDIPLVDSLHDLVDKVMVIRHKERKFGKGCIEKWRNEVPKLYSRFVELVLPFERMLEYNKFLLGGYPVYVDFLLFGVCGNLTYNGWYKFPEDLPKIKDWHERIRSYCYPNPVLSC